MKKAFLLFMLITTSCEYKGNEGQESQASEKGKSFADTLQVNAKSDYRIEEVVLKDDTLFMVPHARLFYYPFGETNDFHGIYQNIFEQAGYSLDSTFFKGDTKIYKVTKSDNKVYFIDDYPETGKEEILRADVSEPGAQLFDGVQIGMSKKKFFEFFFAQYDARYDQVSVVSMETAVTGVWYYFYFSGVKLASISIQTDFTINID